MVTGTDRGPIGPLTLPMLIQALFGRRKTGTLILQDESIKKSLYLDQGRVVFAASTDVDDRLGGLYLRHKMITLSTLKAAASSALSENKRLGTVLVEMKAIRPEDLIWGVTEQVRQMVVGLFRWTRGEYVFIEGELPSDEVITLKMHTGDLIMTGIKSIEAWSRVEMAVGDLDTRYDASPQLQERAAELTLALDEWTLLSHCESGATLGDICGRSALGDFEVCRSIWAFMVIGLLLKKEAAETLTAV